MTNHNREEIIKKSLELFYSSGYKQTTLRKIGEEVGTYHSAILNNFKKKSDLAAIFITRYIVNLRKITDNFCDEVLPKEMYEGNKELYFTLAFFSLHFKLIIKDDSFSRFYYEFLNQEKTDFNEIAQNKGPIKNKYYSVLEENNIKKINIQLMNNSIISYVDSMICLSCSKKVLNLYDAVKLFMKFYFDMNYINSKANENEIDVFLCSYIDPYETTHINIYHDLLSLEEQSS